MYGLFGRIRLRLRKNSLELLKYLGVDDKKRTLYMTKRDRQALLIDVISELEIDTQEELHRVMAERGASVTQATISRDINELKISKVPTGNGTVKYAKIVGGHDSHLTGKYIRVLRDAFMSMDSAQNILVVRTVSGMASAVAAALDAMEMKEVVGSIAGDDTIMMAIRTTAETKIVMDKIREII